MQKDRRSAKVHLIKDRFSQTDEQNGDENKQNKLEYENDDDGNS